MRIKLGIREGDLIGFTIEKNHRVYIEKMNQGVWCPIFEGDSLKKEANKVECVISNNQGLLYQSNEGEWLLLAAEVAQLLRSN